MSGYETSSGIIQSNQIYLISYEKIRKTNFIKWNCHNAQSMDEHVLSGFEVLCMRTRKNGNTNPGIGKAKKQNKSKRAGVITQYQTRGRINYLQ